MVSSLRKILTRLFSDAFSSCGFERGYGEVVGSERQDLGQFQCNGALAAARLVGKSGRHVAEEVINQLETQSIFSGLSIAGPGFINITLSDGFLASHVQSILTDDRMGTDLVPDTKRVIIDFGGPNVAKPMHVGHLRSTIIGDCLQRLFRFVGHSVSSDIHLGDWGLQMGMLIAELERRRPELQYFRQEYTGPYPDVPPVTIADLEQMYPEAAARCDNDGSAMENARRATAELQAGRAGYRALWRHFVAVTERALKEDFAALGVSFDLWYGESRYSERIPRLINRLELSGIAQRSEGALVVHVSTDADSTVLPPLILVKSDGGFLYGTTDMAAIDERVQDLGADIILYVVDQRQGLHFEQVFRAAKLSGIAANTKLEHIGFGTVNGPDGKPLKTRAGGAVKLEDLIAMVRERAMARMVEANLADCCSALERRDIASKVAIAALKFADLVNCRTSDYVFDFDRFTAFEGRTGPYLLYVCVRIKSILRKAAEKGYEPGSILPPAHSVERELMLRLCGLPDEVKRSYLERAPNHLCEFAYDVAQCFNQFYRQHHIIGEKNSSRRSSWLALAKLCFNEIMLMMDVLGIEVPDRM